MGDISSTNKLQNDDDDMNRFHFIDKANWSRNDQHTVCMMIGCDNNFTNTRRKHHCRVCGAIVCGNCSKNRVNSKRICDQCFNQNNDETLLIKTKKFTKNTTKHNEEQKQIETDNKILRGYLFDLNANKLWIELTESMLIFNDKNQEKINMFDLRMFAKIQKCNITFPDKPFGIELIYKSNVKPELLYCFEEETKRNEWFEVIVNRMETIKYDEKPNEENHNLIFSSWTLIEDNLYMIQLTNHGILKINGNGRHEQEEMNQYSKIEVINTENYCYKHGLRLINQEKETKTKTLYFEGNNLRLEWFAHFDFVLNNKMENDEEKEHEEEKQDDDDQSNSNNYALEEISNFYQEIELNKEYESESLSSLLSKKLNVRKNNVYRYITNMFHQQLIGNDNNNEKECNFSQNECPFLKQQKKSENITRNTKDLLLNELLNNIHQTLYHKNIESTTQRNNKFIIQTKEENDENKEKVEKIELNENTICEFAFGEALVYYECFKNLENYIEAHFDNLKDELLKNPYYQLSEEEYYKYYLKAVELQQTEIFQNMKAKEDGERNKKAAINKGDEMRIYHLMSLMIYCNEDELQRIFKKQCRKININEDRNSVYERNKFIANWTRYLMESCRFYGTEMTQNEFFFCGVDRKMVFQSFGFTNRCPLSTTKSLQTAYNFATNHGIIIKIKARENNQRYFNMELLSNYPSEKERFFAGLTELQIIDILIDTKSHKQQILCLNLLQLILGGNLFYFPFNSDLISIETQEMLLKILNDDSECDEYFIHLKNELIQSFINNGDPFGKRKLHFNIPELSKLQNEELIGSIKLNIQQTNKIKYIENIKEIHFKEDVINYLIEMKSGTKAIKIGEYVVDNQYKFDIIIRKIPSKNGNYLIMGIYLQTQIFKGMAMLYDCVCPQVEYQKINDFANPCIMNNYSHGFNLFLCDKIRDLHDLSFLFNIKVISIIN